METGLRGHTALVTGGGSGIGRGIAVALAEEGVDVAIASRDPDPDTVREIAAHGVRCVPIHADVSREAEVDRMVDEAVERLGHIDHYVNNAAWAWHQSVTRIDAVSWYATLDTNLSAAVWACRDVGRHMIDRARGSIVIIGSTSRFNPSFRETAYRISKTGLKVLVENLAIELAPHGVRVNMVSPGHFRTRLTSTVKPEAERKLLRLIPAHRFGEPWEVGRAVLMLLSDTLSPYTIGADIVVDGGLHLRPIQLMTEQEERELNP